MDKVIIDRLHARGILGVYDHERKNRREILISLALDTDSRAAGQSDDLRDCVDYAELCAMIQELVGRAERRTIEALAEDIAASCLSRKGVLRAWVRVEKPGAVPGADAVGIEIERP